MNVNGMKGKENMRSENLLTVEQLQKLTTARLLNLKRALNPIIGRISFYGRSDTPLDNEDRIFNEYYENVKNILNTREHVER